MIRKITADCEIGSGVNITGPLQINNDWPGTFFRGDESGSHCNFLRKIAEKMQSMEMDGASEYLRNLADEFAKCWVPQ